MVLWSLTVIKMSHKKVKDSLWPRRDRCRVPDVTYGFITKS